MSKTSLAGVAFSAAAVASMTMAFSSAADAPIPNISSLNKKPEIIERHSCTVTRFASNDAVFRSRVLEHAANQRLAVTVELQGQRPQVAVAPEGVTVAQAKAAANSTCARVASQLQATSGMPLAVHTPRVI